MPKHVMMWWIAGGSAMVSATLTYVMMRRMARYAPSQTVEAARRPVGRSWKDVWTKALLRFRVGACHVLAVVRPRVAPAEDQISHPTASPGHSAFDSYRSGVLRQLDDDERAFHDFLTRLRLAKDREEFDRFMAEHRGHAAATPHTGSRESGF